MCCGVQPQDPRVITAGTEFMEAFQLALAARARTLAVELEINIELSTTNVRCRNLNVLAVECT